MAGPLIGAAVRAATKYGPKVLKAAKGALKSGPKRVKKVKAKTHMERVNKRTGATNRTTVQTHKASTGKTRSGKFASAKSAQSKGAKMYRGGMKAKRARQAKDAVKGTITGTAVGAGIGSMLDSPPKKPKPTPVSTKKPTSTPKTTAPKATAPVSTVKTKGGDYPVYKKGSSESSSFRSAFADARKSGKKNFTWQGRKYNTKVK